MVQTGVVAVLVAVSIVGAHAAGIGYPTKGSSGPRCYNCNYIPESTSGTSICKLEVDSDFERVDKWTCKSETCFMRRDKSGLIYRGCANPENLPTSVYSEEQCLTQMYTGSVWWFCQGSLCNNVTIGSSEETCSEAVAAQVAMMDAHQTPVHPMGGYQPATVEVPTEAPHEPAPTPVEPHRYAAPDPTPFEPQGYSPPAPVKSQGYGPAPPAPLPVEPQTYGPAPVEPQGYGPVPVPVVPAPSYAPEPTPVWVQAHEPEVVVHMHPDPVLGEQTYSMNTPDEESTEEDMDMQVHNPCDGYCKFNPSGLFSDPRSPKGFIQCISGYHCICCKPIFHRCAPGTVFDPTKSVCTSGGYGLIKVEHW